MGTSDSTSSSCAKCVRIPYREYLTTLFLACVIAGIIGFLVGYYQGLQVPREPTFGEKIYHNNAERTKAAKLLRVCNGK